MDPIQLLNKTKAAFISHQCGNTRRHYTDALKSAAISLLKSYSLVELASQLKISVRSLELWRKNYHASRKSPPFIPLTLDEGDTACSPQNTESFVLKLPHQLELILPAKSIKETTRFISTLIKEMSECSI